MSQYDDVMNKKAVALRYDENKDVAPVIVASGLGYMAERIVEMANENGVPVYEDNSLATVLTQLDLGTAIPEELYQAIVDIYAYFLKYNPQKIKEAEQQREETEEKLDETEENLKGLNEQHSSLQGTLSTLNTELTQVSNNLNELEEQITEKEAEIDDLEKQIAQVEEELAEAIALKEEQYATMKKQIQFAYERSSNLYMELFFSSGSLSDFLNKNEYIEQLSAYQGKVLDEYKAAQAAMEQKQLELEQEAAETAAAAARDEAGALLTERDSLEAQVAALTALYRLQQLYAARDLESCEAEIGALDSGSLLDSLDAVSREREWSVTPPSERYLELKEAVRALEDRAP